MSLGHRFPARPVLVLCIGFILLVNQGYAAEKTVDDSEPTFNWSRMRRAGFPQSIASWAKCQRQKHYQGYYVGGGATFFGNERCPHEGTWGWDYAPRFSRVRLKWFHGRKYQSGEGQYETDRRNVPIRRFGWLKSR
jgi:hypothetical protein